MAGNWPRVLSIQSHVVSGYVGNKSATFPLQVLGFEVDTINSVQFSNHTGYGYWKGQVLHENELAELMDGLHHNRLDHYTHLLTGYVGSASFLKQIAQVVQQLRKINPNLVYVCDPVLGDNGKLYVPEELVGIYRNTILPLADIITPNQFEAELLSGGKPIKSKEDAWNNLLGLASNWNGDRKASVTINIPKIPLSFTGSGDLFAAVFLAWMTKSNNELKTSIEKTVSTLQAVLKRTYQHAKESGKTGMFNLELQLIQCKNEIENPQVSIEATLL
ncbi:hypothetical protein L9F63_013176 [Diploptera punctata]|uniref:Pyridoxal kinase n=1 Tax=Diploptera punctata TaxID=6984 RepID=A0AAD8AAU3_DIPPU|nr:hypothetical protein L9F63_013176 [Diploptera punctata]